MNKTRGKLVTVVMVLILSTLACTVYSIEHREDLCEAMGGSWYEEKYGADGFLIRDGECRKPYLGKPASEFLQLLEY